jgi:CheY-like chemotaxis protein
MERARATVLVVEDDPWTRWVESELLRDDGYLVFEAGTGEQGLYMAAAHAPDVILLDLGLPRMSGVDVLHHLKANPATREIPVFVVSSYASLLRDEDARQVAGRLQKPFDCAELLTEVERGVRERAEAIRAAPTVAERQHHPAPETAPR